MSWGVSCLSVKFVEKDIQTALGLMRCGAYIMTNVGMAFKWSLLHALMTRIRKDGLRGWRLFGVNITYMLR